MSPSYTGYNHDIGYRQRAYALIYIHWLSVSDLPSPKIKLKTLWSSRRLPRDLVVG